MSYYYSDKVQLNGKKCMGDIMAIVDFSYKEELESLCTYNDLFPREDLVSVFSRGFDYEEHKNTYWFGWKITTDRELCKREEERCFEEFNIFLNELNRYHIDYSIIGKVIEPSKKKHEYGNYRYMWAGWKVTIFIDKNKKWWFYKLTRKLGYESALKSLKMGAGPWYERIKDTKPVKDIVYKVQSELQWELKKRQPNREGLVSDISPGGIHMYPPGSVISFYDYGYQHMNSDQLAAFTAIYLETIINYFNKRADILCVEVKIEGPCMQQPYEFGGCGISHWLYFKEIKPNPQLISW